MKSQVLSWSDGGSFGLDQRQAKNLNALRGRYEKMPADPHLNNGEGERYRRYGRFLIDPQSNALSIFAHDSFFQPKEFDVLYGDIHRNFPPLTAEEYDNPFLQELVVQNYYALPLTAKERHAPYEVSLHMIRIQATAESTKGRPAPEGVHRDGYRFGAIHLMNRINVEGADNGIYNLQKTLVRQERLRRPMDSIYFDDAAILHGVSPFFQADPTQPATRDMLILLYQPLSESPQKPGLLLKKLRHMK